MHDTLATLTLPKIIDFRETIYAWSRANGRSLPWRQARNPYATLISEVMLQQTQVDRVLVKYAAFLSRFPDFPALAAAPLADLLKMWQGLGYNRRALSLKACAELVVTRFGGTLPESVDELLALPGIGPYTARAVAAFAFGRPTVFIETNIRAVFIHHFCSDRRNVHDREILPLVAAMVDAADPGAWYNALMDYGAMLKKVHDNPARRSVHHVRQPPFTGSNRQLRGRMLQVLLATPGMSKEELVTILDADGLAIDRNLRGLEKEGFIETGPDGIAIRTAPPGATGEK